MFQYWDGPFLGLSLASDQLDFLGMAPEMDHSGSQSHLLLPRARVGFSPSLQYIVGWSLQGHWKLKECRTSNSFFSEMWDLFETQITGIIQVSVHVPIK